MVESKRKGMMFFAVGLLGSLLVGGLSHVVKGDYEQAVADAQFYCDMVDQGTWPPDADRGCESPNAKSPMDIADVPDMPQEIDQRMAAK